MIFLFNYLILSVLLFTYLEFIKVYKYLDIDIDFNCDLKCNNIVGNKIIGDEKTYYNFWEY